MQTSVDTVIIGAGPYGLSLAAHLQGTFRIFGKPMNAWRSQMPKGMSLKSDGFASNLFDPKGHFTLERFCAERKIPYGRRVPVPLDVFVDYGMAFQQQLVPMVEDKAVTGLSRQPGGFGLILSDGERVTCRNVVVAVGISDFSHIPPVLANLPSDLVSHSSCHHELDGFRGRHVAVIGAGSSATDLAILLHESGAKVELIARGATIPFGGEPESDKAPSKWQRLRYPPSGLGPGWRSKFASDAPGLFRFLPQDVRLKIVRTSLGPRSAWFMKDRLIGKVEIKTDSSVQQAERQGDQVRLVLRTKAGAVRETTVDHVIASTGYKIDLNKLAFLDKDVIRSLTMVENTPVLSRRFETSLPGLYFIGVTAANSFGPVMRFVYGAGYAARAVSAGISGRK
jgi:thioredoxin reductase